ncbi:MAG: hypothetical protein WA432_01440 [Candidatus Babeliaceae bacterium]
MKYFKLLVLMIFSYLSMRAMQAEELQKILQESQKLALDPLDSWNEKSISSYEKKCKDQIQIIKTHQKQNSNDPDVIKKLKTAYRKIVSKLFFIQSIQDFKDNKKEKLEFFRKLTNPRGPSFNDFLYADITTRHGIRSLQIIIPDMYADILNQSKSYIDKKTKDRFVSDYLNACINFALLTIPKLFDIQFVQEELSALKKKIQGGYKLLKSEIQNDIDENYFDLVKAIDAIYNQLDNNKQLEFIYTQLDEARAIFVSDMPSILTQLSNDLLALRLRF